MARCRMLTPDSLNEVLTRSLTRYASQSALLRLTVCHFSIPRDYFAGFAGLFRTFTDFDPFLPFNVFRRKPMQKRVSKPVPVSPLQPHRR